MSAASIAVRSLRALQTIQLLIPGYRRHMRSLMADHGVDVNGVVLIPGRLEAWVWPDSRREAWMDETGGARGRFLAPIPDPERKGWGKLLLIGSRVVELQANRPTDVEDWMIRSSAAKDQRADYGAESAVQAA